MKHLGLTRRLLLQIVGAACFLAATGFGAQATEKWDFTIYYGPGHPLTKLYQALAEDISERSNGEIEITVRTAGELPFKATEAVPVVGNGQAEMALGYMGFIAGTTKIAALPGLPFLIRNAEEAETAMEILLPYIDKALQENGAEILLWNGQHWPQNLYGRGEPVKNLKELKGRNARGSSPEQGDIIRTYGGAPVTLTTAEVPEAMNRGVVDAVFTGAANITGSKWTEFLEWGYLADPNTGIEYVMINKDLYDGLSPELRKMIDDTVAEHGPKMSAALKAVNDESQAKLREQLEIIDASPEDIKAYEAEFAPYWAEWAEDAGPDAQEALTKIRKALNK